MTLHVSLTDETRHLIDAAALARMKPTAVLINTSRGPVVDQAALTEALRGRDDLWGAGLDVTDPEPMRADDPLVSLPNCLVVPHVASASRATRDKMAEKAARNVLAGVRGEPLPNPVRRRRSEEAWAVPSSGSGSTDVDSPSAVRHRPGAPGPTRRNEMASVDEAVLTQDRNIETRTGRPIDEWVELARASGKAKHGEIVAWLKTEHGFGHGDANLVALMALRGPDAPGRATIWSMRSIRARRRRCDRSTTGSSQLARSFGGDVELAPKQTYVSLRRKKQFGTVGPASGGRLEVGFNLKGVEPAGRLEASSGMCTHRVRLSDPAEFDDEVVGWLREAYDRA